MFSSAPIFNLHLIGATPERAGQGADSQEDFQ
jgi:hypothetical protein